MAMFCGFGFESVVATKPCGAALNEHGQGVKFYMI
jgi:hypothetical protein